MKPKKVLLYCCCSLLLLASIGQSLSAQIGAPKWVQKCGKTDLYPDDVFVTGYGISIVDSKRQKIDAVVDAKESARTKLIESIRVTINSRAEVLKSQVDKEVSQSFKKSVHTFSTIELHDIQFEEHFDSRQKKAYALALVRRAELKNFYKEQLAELYQAIVSKYTQAEKQYKNGNKAEALKLYLDCSKLYRDAHTTKTVLRAIDRRAKSTPCPIKEDEVLTAIDDIVDKDIESLEDAGYYLAYCLQEQVGLSGKNILLQPFTYQDTEMSSEYANYFGQRYGSQLMKVGNCQISNEIDISGRSRNHYVITGFYWDKGDYINMLSHIKDVTTGNMIATAEINIPKNLIEKEGLAYIPHNFNNAYEDLKLFRTDEDASNGLNLEIWTNKGAENLIFKEDEEMRVAVRVNQSCNIRFIYHLADGQRVLLLDSYHIGPHQVNKVVEIPDTFVCIPPFGAEFLQVNAQTKTFPTLDTTSDGDYDYINEPLKIILQKTRGMKKKRKEDVQLRAEKRIVITTMKK